MFYLIIYLYVFMNIKITKDLEIIKQPNYKNILKGSMLFNIVLAGLVISAFTTKPKVVYVVKEKIVEKMVPEDINVSDSTVLKELVKGKCILPNVALAQAKVETGNYKSEVCKQNKNLFGIKKHKCQYVTGENLNHATYKTYKDNIKCYLHIQEHYLKKIDGKYAEAPGYVTYLKKIK